MRWIWVGLIAGVVLACAGTHRTVDSGLFPEQVSVTVRAVDGSGRPVPGATVGLRRAEQGSMRGRSGITDAMGTVVLRVSPGWYILQAEARTFARTVRTDARIASGSDARLDVMLEREVREADESRRSQNLVPDSRHYALPVRASQTESRPLPTATIEGFVTAGGRVPLSEVEVSVRCAGASEVRAFTDLAGGYSALIPARIECFVHAVASCLNVTPPRPLPVGFTPRKLRVSSSSRESLDLEPRLGNASLFVSVDSSRDDISAFVLPGDIDWPRTVEALEELRRSGIDPDPPCFSRVSEEGNPLIPLHPPADFGFRNLPPGHYTAFIETETGDGISLARIPLDLSGRQSRAIRLARPNDG
jgi:hypothetical protein